MDDLRPALRWYLGLSYLAAGLLILDGLYSLTISGAWRLADAEASLIFVALTYLSERLTARLAGGYAQSMSTVLLITAALVLPPPYPLLVALFVMLAADLPRPLPLYKRLYNIAHATLATGSASLTFALLAPPLPHWPPGHLVEHIPAIGVLALVFGVVDIGSLQIVMFLAHETAPDARRGVSFHRTTLKTLLPNGVAIGLGLLAAIVWANAPVALPLFLLPVLTLHGTFRSIEQAEERAATLEAHNVQLETVIHAGQHLTLHQSRVDLLRGLAATAQEVARAESVAVYLPDETDPAMLGRVLVLPSEASVSIPDLISAPLPSPDTVITPRPDDTGTIILPLEADGQSIGHVHLHGVTAAADAHTEYALALLANQAAIAIQNAQLHERVLGQVTIDGLTGLPNHRAFHARLEEEIARCRRLGQPASLLLIDIDGLAAINSVGGLSLGDAVLTAVAVTIRQIVRASDLVARDDGDAFAVLLLDTERREAIDTANRLQAAIRTGDLPTRVRVSIGLATCPDHATTRAELVRAAHQALAGAKALGKDRMAEPEDGAGLLATDVGPVAESLAHGNLAAVMALAVAVDAKDPYTQGHAQRVSQYAVAIGRALGLAAADLERLELAALLHDVGKIAVPDAILKKEGRLSDEEYAVITEHPVTGERMLAGLPYLAKDILPAVRHHHERWDGRGYPDGLAGAALPLDAAILTVADAFDAMTSTRTYRAALPLREAVRRIQEGSGTHFAPHVVLAFDQALARGDLAVNRTSAATQVRTA